MKYLSVAACACMTESDGVNCIGDACCTVVCILPRRTDLAGAAAPRTGASSGPVRPPPQTQQQFLIPNAQSLTSDPNPLSCCRCRLHVE